MFSCGSQHKHYELLVTFVLFSSAVNHDDAATLFLFRLLPCHGLPRRIFCLHVVLSSASSSVTSSTAMSSLTAVVEVMEESAEDAGD